MLQMKEIQEHYPRSPPPPDMVEYFKQKLRQRIQRSIQRVYEHGSVQRNDRSVTTPSPQERIWQEIQNQQALLNQAIREGCSATLRAAEADGNSERARQDIERYKEQSIRERITADECARKTEEISARIQQLTNELEAMKSGCSSC